MMEAHVRSFIVIPAEIHFIISADNTIRFPQHLITYWDMISGMVTGVLEVDAVI